MARGAVPPSPDGVARNVSTTWSRRSADLAREVRALRSAVDRLNRDAAAPAAAPEPAAARRRARTPIRRLSRSERSRPSAGRGGAFGWQSVGAGSARSRSLDFESLIGRYGTLALASLTILLGAGAFLSWAIAQGKIGPELRVAFGAIGAAVVGAAGWRLRARGSKRFGSTLLALALALVHVDAWGAGPYLQLVPSPVALGVAAAASVALAVLAWTNGEEALFSVGVGGALIAPFVTSRDAGSVPALLIYGFVVLSTGLAALRGRAWRTAVHRDDHRVLALHGDRRVRDGAPRADARAGLPGAVRDRHRVGRARADARHVGSTHRAVGAGGAVRRAVVGDDRPGAVERSGDTGGARHADGVRGGAGRDNAGRGGRSDPTAVVHRGRAADRVRLHRPRRRERLVAPHARRARVDGGGCRGRVSPAGRASDAPHGRRYRERRSRSCSPWSGRR